MASTVRATPTEAATRWREKLASAGPAIEAGVKRVQESPGVAAARESAKWEQRLRESMPKWKARLQNLPIEAWRDPMLKVGVARVAQGAQEKEHKMVAFLNEFLPFVESVKQRVKQMPSTTPQQRIARMVANAEALRGFKRSGTGTGA